MARQPKGSFHILVKVKKKYKIISCLSITKGINSKFIMLLILAISKQNKIKI